MLHGVMVPCSVLPAPEFRGGDWHLIDDLISDRSAAVRVASLVFDNWDVDDGHPVAAAGEQQSMQMRLLSSAKT